MSVFETLEFSISQHIASITLNRPEMANGMNMAMGKELMQAAILCDNSEQVRVVVIKANGRFFSAGGDLKSFVAHGDNIASAIKELTTYLHTAISLFARMKAPVITAINGAAAGAGLSLAVSGDLVLATESAKFTMANTAVGLSPDGSATYYLPRLIGLRRTQELMITNRRLSAAEALEWGLVTRVVSDDRLQEETDKLAQHLANGPTQAFGSVKKLLLDSFGNSLETQLELESRSISAMTTTEDGQEGIRAFVEKRSPQFTGK